MVTPVLGRFEVLLHQIAAVAVLHDLPVGHLVALADGLLREMLRLVMRMRRVMMLLGSVVRPAGVMMLRRGVVARV